ncbi:hypothetical protein C2E23DRAFT_577751 [Lenzites betulinus]|nr:hypothetical protein C2E23DRAFT_577751 [Lenzites betulinus]
MYMLSSIASLANCGISSARLLNPPPLLFPFAAVLRLRSEPDARSRGRNSRSFQLDGLAATLGAVASSRRRDAPKAAEQRPSRQLWRPQSTLSPPPLVRGQLGGWHRGHAWDVHRRRCCANSREKNGRAVDGSDVVALHVYVHPVSIVIRRPDSDAFSRGYALRTWMGVPKV